MTFLFALVAWAASARASHVCDPLLAAHFPPSYTWTGEPDPDFSRWAAGTANEVVARVTTGEDVEVGLANVAIERRMFAGEDPASEMGVPRRDLPPSTWQSRVGHEAIDELDPRREAFIDDVIARHPKLAAPFTTWREFNFVRAPDPDREWPIANVRYEFTETVRNEIVTELQLVERAGLDGLVLTHADVELMALVLTDVTTQVRRMLREGGSKRSFARALHGYFNAMPFSRGSGTIGRIYFTALHRVLFDETITLSADVDVRAMTTSPRVFVAQFGHGKLIDRPARR